MIDDRNVMPESYEQWKYCIEVLGKIELTPAFVGQRLAIMEDDQHAETKKFVKLYGLDRLQRTVDWFRRADSELSKN